MRTILLTVLISVAAICGAQDVTYATISTKGGQQIKVALYKTDLESSVLKDIDEKYCAMFPAATMLKGSSRKYNCHSYAWNMTDGGSACWINDKEDEKPNLSKYWTNDYYSEVSENDALKIHYSDDHSAVKSSVSGMYESKWGKGPLMRHAPGYGPYKDMDKRKYYNHVVPTPVYGPLICSVGQGEIVPNTAASYYPSSSQITRSQISRVEYSIYSPKGEDAVAEGTAVVNSISGDVLNVTFTARGVYEMSVSYYNKFNEFMGSFSYEPLVAL